MDMATVSRWVGPVVMTVLVSSTAPGQSSEPAGGRSAERRAAILLPAGDLFRGVLADPTELEFFASFHGVSSPTRGSRIGSVAMGNTIGFIRWAGATEDEGLQVGLSGGVLAQFDLTKPSRDLVNADYIVGLPITYRRGAYSARFRVYHQSSHLGDEFVENNDIERLNLSFEAFELLLSRDFGPFRGYGGGEYRFNRTPKRDLEHGLLHGGVEYRHRGALFRLGRTVAARPLVAVDVKSFEQRDWEAGVSGRVGIELGSLPGGGGRTVSFLVEAYDGPNPYGQFYFEDIQFIGFGAHFRY